MDVRVVAFLLRNDRQQQFLHHVEYALVLFRIFGVCNEYHTDVEALPNELVGKMLLGKRLEAWLRVLKLIVQPCSLAARVDEASDQKRWNASRLGIYDFCVPRCSIPPIRVLLCCFDRLPPEVQVHSEDKAPQGIRLPTCEVHFR